MAKKSNIVLDKATIERYVAEYAELSKKGKLIDDRKKVLSDAIKTYAQNNGTKDDKGSFFCENDQFTFGANCKKSMSINEERAINLVKSKGFDDCLRTVITIDESAIEDRLSKGDITPSELESITDSKVTYAVAVKAKESADDMPVVQQTEVVAASRKKPLLTKKPKK